MTEAFKEKNESAAKSAAAAANSLEAYRPRAVHSTEGTAPDPWPISSASGPACNGRTSTSVEMLLPTPLPHQRRRVACIVDSTTETAPKGQYCILRQRGWRGIPEPPPRLFEGKKGLSEPTAAAVRRVGRKVGRGRPTAPLLPESPQEDPLFTLKDDPLSALPHAQERDERCRRHLQLPPPPPAWGAGETLLRAVPIPLHMMIYHGSY